jgi:hypothetical protein
MRIIRKLQIALCLVVILTSDVGGVRFQNATLVETSSSIPLIRAKNGPIKIRPKNPGGMKVPYMGIRILNNLDQTDEEPVVLAPFPEEPILLAESEAKEDVAEIIPPKIIPGLVALSPDPVKTLAAEKPPISKMIYWVQLASLRTELQAKEEWERIKIEHSIIVKGLNLTVSRADLGTKGIFYRLLVGPLPDKFTAQEFCLSAKVYKIACLIHRSSPLS